MRSSSLRSDATGLSALSHKRHSRKFPRGRRVCGVTRFSKRSLLRVQLGHEHLDGPGPATS